jgi:hypothetical protein
MLRKKLSRTHFIRALEMCIQAESICNIQYHGTGQFDQDPSNHTQHSRGWVVDCGIPQ